MLAVAQRPYPRMDAPSSQAPIPAVLAFGLVYDAIVVASELPATTSYSSTCWGWTCGVVLRSPPVARTTASEVRRPRQKWMSYACSIPSTGISQSSTPLDMP